ncbi:MAG: glycosyltransferase family 39 protein [Planctomycetes bacterium]|nr:glycosyltransferase family 39 protein [Planctomycetota bacterium]
MNRGVLAAAFACLACALLLPAQALLEYLLAGNETRRAALERGVDLLRGTLALAGLVLVLVERLAPRGDDFEPLLRTGIRTPPRLDASALWALGGLVVLALALRTSGLGSGLCFDELDTLVHYARKQPREIVSTFDSQNQHLLYSLLARLSFGAFGESAWAVRLPAVVLGVLGVLALHRFARLVTDAREAIFSATLLAVSYHHVWFSQDARGYTGLLLFTLLGSAEFLRMCASSHSRGVAAPLRYGAWMALATWIHATAVFVVAAHVLVWAGCALCARGRRVGTAHHQVLSGFVMATTISLVLHALVLPQYIATLLAPTMPRAQVEWKDPTWLVAETVRGLSQGVPGGAFTLALGLAVLALGLRSYWRQSRALTLTFLLGVAVTIAVLLATRHNLWPRMFFFAAGFSVLIAVRGVVEWIRIFSFGQFSGLLEKLTTAALALSCLMSAATVPAAWLPKQDFEGAQAFVDRERRPGDAVATVDMTILPYRDYYDCAWTPVDSIEALAALERAHARIWLVYCTPTRLKAAEPELWAHLERDYRVQTTCWGTLGGSEVVVVRRDAGAR